MKVLDRYIGKNIISNVLIVLLVLVVLIYIFTLVEELSKLNQHYPLQSALLYVLYKVPKQAYDFFPMAVLVGSLLGLGSMASQSELIVMRASGMSVKRLVFSTLYTGAFLMLLVALLGEFIVPGSEKQALMLKKGDLSKQFTQAKKGGLWIKNAQNIIHINKIMPDKRLQGITLYQHQGNRLLSKKKIRQAQFQQQQWLLKDIETISLEQQPYKKTLQKQEQWKKLINPDLFQVLVVPPETLPIRELFVYIRYLQKNDLDSGQYSMSFWQKLLSPFSVLVMLMLTIPFVLGSQRDNTAGKRILLGSIVGLAYLMLVNIFSHLGFVYGIPAFISVSLPMLLSLGAAFWYIQRI